MRRFVMAVMCTVALVGFVLAEEFTLQITSISDDGGSVTGTKLAVPMAKKGGGGKGGFGKGEEVTVKVSKDVKVFKGKFDTDAKKQVPDGDDMKLAGLKAAIMSAQNGSVSVDGTALTDKDKLELTVDKGKPMAKLNGKDVDFAKVTVKGKGPLTANVTTDDGGTITQVLVGGKGFGGGGFGKGGAAKKGGGGN
jgi:hypothetical protein